MADVLVFHHAQGLTAGVRAFADALGKAGHRVHTPDLYAGRSFATLAEGLACAQDIGFAELIARGVRAADTLPARSIYLGFSLGVLPAQQLAQTRAGARGAVLCHACVPVREFSPAWPAGVPVQIHAMADDPIFVHEGDLAAAHTLVDTAAAELFVYDGDRHLFADASLASYDADAAAQLTARVLAFLTAHG